MSFVTAAELMREGRRKGYAIGAFNMNNMEIVQAIIEAAEQERSPVIIQASQGAIKYAGIDYIVAMARVAAEKATVPVALNLDHGTSFEQVVQCVAKGFSSVMIDASKYPFDENVALVKRVVEVAHAAGVSVEAELGRIGGTEDDIVVSRREETFTDPGEAARFVELTGVDALAVAIGTAHGVYRGEPKLDFERLETIARSVEIPLVLHGASGVPDESIRRAVGLGIAKINIDTEVRIAFTESLRSFLRDNPSEIDPRKVLALSKKEMTETVRKKMRLFGSSGARV